MAEVWKQKPDALLKHWIFEALYHSQGLTDWERSFLVSVDKQFSKSGRISEKQQDILERIYAERTN